MSEVAAPFTENFALYSPQAIVIQICLIIYALGLENIVLEHYLKFPMQNKEYRNRQGGFLKSCLNH